MFAYCFNNPIVLVDSAGQFPWLVVGFLAVTTFIGAYLGATKDEKPNSSVEKPANNTKTKPIKPIRDDQLLQDTIDRIPKKDVELPAPLKSEPMDKIEDNTLTAQDRMINTIEGAAMGLAVGGLIVICAAGIGTAVVGSATAKIALFGITGKEMFAIGALAYDVLAIFVAPFLGLELEPLEYEP